MGILKPNRSRGRQPYQHPFRDNFIIATLMRLRKSYNIRPTNKAYDHIGTGAELVADYLSGMGFNIQKPGVARVWEKRRTTFPGIDPRK